MYESDFKHPLPTLEEKLYQLYSLNRNYTIDLSFRPAYLQLLEKYGNPHLRLPPVIHVAGTNGKGSVIAMLRSILEAAGYKVHAYTSPHLVRFNERIVLAGQEIEDEVLEGLIDEALSLNDGADLSFFEITTAMAFAAFSRVPADILLLEVGLGGRLDCTNVIKAPLASVITMIGRDHMELLGNSLPEIAGEKAGIIKAHCPCVIGVQSEQAVEAGVSNILESQAKEKGSVSFRYGADWLIEPFEQGQATRMRFIYRGQEMILPLPALEGTHQIENAGAALATLKVIKDQFPVSDRAYIQGLQTAQWPARLQQIQTGALVDLLPEGWEIYLDGGHNEQAGQVLAAQADSWQAKDQKMLHLVLGVMQHKSPREFVAPLSPLLSSLTAVDIADEPASLSAQAIKDAVHDVKVQCQGNVLDAIKHIVSENPVPGRILITGSLYLAGHVLQDYVE